MRSTVTINLSRFAIRITAAILAMMLASTAVAYEIHTDSGTVDVGGLDILQAQTQMTSSANPAAEEAWAEEVLGIDLDFGGVKTETVSYFMTDTFNVIAFELFSDPGYYIIKNARWFALFENTAELGWGVLDISPLADAFNLTWGCQSEDGDCEFTISHVTEFSSTVTQVSEPGSMLLMLLGALGLLVSRRRQR